MFLNASKEQLVKVIPTAFLEPSEVQLFVSRNPIKTLTGTQVCLHKMPRNAHNYTKN